MQGDTFRSQYGLRLKAARDRAAGLVALKAQTQAELTARSQEVLTLSATVERLLKVGELFRALMDRMVMDHVRSIEGVVTEGLQTIFLDQDLHFDAEVTTRGNKIVIDFYLKQANKRVVIRAHPLEAFGGGPSSVASLILRVLALRRLGKWPVLLLDETMGAVSDRYIERTGQFLLELARKTGMTVLLVSHKARFLEHATIGYQATSVVGVDGANHLRLVKETA